MTLAKIENNKGTAIQLRKEIVTDERVAKALSISEMAVFESSTKRLIRSIPDEELVCKISDFVNILAIDLGINGEIDQYAKTRFYDLLRRFYSDLALAEIKTAFELSMIGELDNFLPKNGKGEPDNNHYQNFSASYVTKILGAYRKRRGFVMEKAHKAVPPPPEKSKSIDIRLIRTEAFKRNKAKFLQYKYTGVFDIGVIQEKIIYELFRKNWIADSVVVSEEEKQKALSKYIHGPSSTNKYTLESIKRTGTKHENVIIGAFSFAMRREVKRVFDYCIENELQIDKYLI